MATVTIQSNKNILTVGKKKDGTYSFRLKDTLGGDYKMKMNSPDEVFNAAFEMADNNDIGRELSRKIRVTWDKIEGH
jgi:hypothetical protein